MGAISYNAHLQAKSMSFAHHTLAAQPPSHPLESPLPCLSVVVLWPNIVPEEDVEAANDPNVEQAEKKLWTCM